MRVVLDTNVLLPALFGRGVCQAVLELVVESGQCTLVLSEFILNELRRVAAKKFRVPESEVDAATAFLRRNAEVVDPAKMPAATCADQDDLPVLGTPVAATARFLVTGDAELLGLKVVSGVAVISPREFYERLV